jgi:hypothetical protein
VLVLRRRHEPLDPAIVRGVKWRTAQGARRKAKAGRGCGEGPVSSNQWLSFQRTFQELHRARIRIRERDLPCPFFGTHCLMGSFAGSAKDRRGDSYPKCGVTAGGAKAPTSEMWILPGGPSTGIRQMTGSAADSKTRPSGRTRGSAIILRDFSWDSQTAKVVGSEGGRFNRRP